MPAWTSSSSPSVTSPTRAISTDLRLALLVRAERQHAVAVDMLHPSGNATSPQVMQPSCLDAAVAGVAGVIPQRLWGQGHSITLALSSSSSCS